MDEMNPEEQYRCGYVALIGRPNVGKSTLMNRILGQKLSIVTAKPQTTRQQIAGIKTTGRGQVIYIDTPGIHLAAKKALNRYMNRVSDPISFQDVDLILFLVEAGRWTKQDEHVVHSLKSVDVPVILVVNKIDLVPDKTRLLGFLEKEAQSDRFSQVLLIAAKSGDGVDDLENRVLESLPFSRPFFDEEQFYGSQRTFLAAELVREQLMLRLHQEVPYSLTVRNRGVQAGQGCLADRRHHLGGTGPSERDRDWQRRRRAQAGRYPRPAYAAGIVRRKNLPAHLGQGEQGLDRQCACSETVRLRGEVVKVFRFPAPACGGRRLHSTASRSLLLAAPTANMVWFIPVPSG